MARGYFASHISDNLLETPEGYLIAPGVVVGRSGARPGFRERNAVLISAGMQKVVGTTAYRKQMSLNRRGKGVLVG